MNHAFHRTRRRGCGWKKRPKVYPASRNDGFPGLPVPARYRAGEPILTGQNALRGPTSEKRAVKEIKMKTHGGHAFVECGMLPQYHRMTCADKGPAWVRC